jgi:DNA-binding XRE family transcriptional regulator
MTLQEARELAGLKQVELDREAGVPKGTTNDIEQGRNSNPSTDVAIRLVAALKRRGLSGASVEDFFGAEEETPRRRRAAAAR